MARPAPEQTDALGVGVKLDENLLAVLPPNSKVVSVASSGHSLWVGTVRIDVRLPDGGSRVFFKKGASGDLGYNMMKGPFEAEKALHEYIPEHVPRPIAYGTYQSQPDVHFYLCDFVEMLDEVPSTQGWAEAVSALHSRSMGQSPTGKFGFSTTTHLANVPVSNTWNACWAEFWAQQMRSMLDIEEALHGPDDEFTRLKTIFFDAVIPRYLDPLESDGRSILPCLIHSDLWPGNIKPRQNSDSMSMFDSCAYWGHNEAELGICRNPRYRLGKSYLEQYQKYIPISEPKEDFDARNAVYALKFHVLLSVIHHKKPMFRQIAIDEMRSLTELVVDSTGSHAFSRSPVL
ncbi:Fructosamine kinase-domain-containing protein [Xylariomycetidae sp. FL2044]|nr:Fructosamine kinase-domain-containing protein [Xylariomycetidae sp. FL2044]